MNRRMLFMLAAMLLSLSGFSQTDTTGKHNAPDTIKVGNFVIIKKNKPGSSADTATNDHHYSVDVNIFHRDHKPKKRSNISTNWFIFDLGFANVRDNTDYATVNQNPYLNGGAFNKSSLSLKTSKSSNVNLWIFQQKLNITGHILNLKYGLGLEMYNFRYDNNISYNKNPAYVFSDSVNFSKDKLALSYITVPFMLNVNTNPHKRNSFSFSVGASAGYLYNSHTKQISSERGKEKTHGDFDLDPWRFAGIAELGLGPVRVYGSYSFNTLHQDALKQYPYAVGLRFSNW